MYSTHKDYLTYIETSIKAMSDSAGHQVMIKEHSLYMLSYSKIKYTVYYIMQKKST